MVLLRDGDADDVVVEADCFGVCAEGDGGRPDRPPPQGEGPGARYVSASRRFGAMAPIVARARAGDAYAFEYYVGEGGGHGLYVRGFVATAGDASWQSEVAAAAAASSAAPVPPVQMYMETHSASIEASIAAAVASALREQPANPLLHITNRLRADAGAGDATDARLAASEAARRDVEAQLAEARRQIREMERSGAMLERTGSMMRGDL